MKLLITADLHLRLQEPYGQTNPETGLNTRLEDKLGLLKKLVSIAVDEEVIGFHILGDVFDRLNPPEILRQEFIRTVVKPLREADIPLFVVAGNHDTNLAGTINLGGERDLGSLCLMDEPKKIDIAGVSIGFWPYGRDLPEITDVLLAHEMIEGALMGGQAYVPEGGRSIKDLSKFKLVISGHVHKPQNITDNIIYVGALARQNFGERDEPRRAILLRVGTTGGDPTIEEIPLEDRPFCQFDLEEGGNDSKIQPFPSGAVVKLVLSGSRAWIGSRPLEDAKVSLLKRGAHQVIFDLRPRQDVERSERIDGAGRSLVEELAAYAEDNDGPDDRLAIGTRLLNEEGN